MSQERKNFESGKCTHNLDTPEKGHIKSQLIFWTVSLLSGNSLSSTKIINIISGTLNSYYRREGTCFRSGFIDTDEKTGVEKYLLISL